MTPQSKIFTGLAAAIAAATLAVGTTSCDEDSTTTTSTPDDSVEEAAFGLGDAIETAQRELAGGITVAAEYETGKSGSIFEIEILIDGEVREVFIDPSNGRVVEVKVDPEDLEWATATAARLRDANMTLLRAVETAETEAHGTALEVELGKSGIEVEVVAGESKLEVEIALDGTVTAVEAKDGGLRSAGDEDEDEDDDENDEDDDDDG